jgi:hypothetical protein
VLAADERDLLRHDLRRRPPAAEHVRVHQLGAGQPGPEPRREVARRRPLEIRPALPADVALGEGLDLEAVTARQRDARRRGVPRQQRR